MNCSKNGHSWFAPHLSVTDDTSCTYTSPLNFAGLNCSTDSQAFDQCPLSSFLQRRNRWLCAVWIAGKENVKNYIHINKVRKTLTTTKTCAVQSYGICSIITATQSLPGSFFEFEFYKSICMLLASHADVLKGSSRVPAISWDRNAWRTPRNVYHGNNQLIFYLESSLKFIRLFRVVFSSQQRLNRPAVNAVQWRHSLPENRVVILIGWLSKYSHNYEKF